MRRLFSLARDFFRDRRGAMGVMTLIAAPTFVAITGAAIDYGRAGAASNDLQHAVDSAALALANAQVLEKMRPDSDGGLFVRSNIRKGANIDVQTVAVTQREGGYAEVIAYATHKPIFMAMAGISSWDITARAVAQFDDPEDIDIFVLMDNSPSMLIGATQADMAGIEKINKKMGEGNCAFACHYKNRDSYTKAHKAGWATRLDAAKLAMKDALKIAKDASDASDSDIWFKIKTFTAGYHNEKYGKVKSVIQSGAIDKIAPIKQPNKHIYEQSDQQMALASASSDIAKQRKSHPDRRPFMIFITDGVIDANYKKRVIEPVDPDWCDAIKAQGVRVGVIYTTYFELPKNGFWRSKVKPFNHKIGPNLEACASPGWFFEAQYGADISRAFQNLMQFALPKPRLTN